MEKEAETPGSDDDKKVSPKQEAGVKRRYKKRQQEPVRRYPVEPRVVQIVRRPKTFVNHTYHDFSFVPPESGYKPPVDLARMTFSQTLHFVLSDEANSNRITWMPHGRAFKIVDSNELEKHVLAKYFGHKCLARFLTQLRRHGFKALTAKDQGCFYHECFLRGLSHLCVYMPTQLVEPRKRKPDPENEPNFYEIDKIFPLDREAATMAAVKETIDKMRSTTQTGAAGSITDISNATPVNHEEQANSAFLQQGNPNPLLPTDPLLLTDPILSTGRDSIESGLSVLRNQEIANVLIARRLLQQEIPQRGTPPSLSSSLFLNLLPSDNRLPGASSLVLRDLRANQDTLQNPGVASAIANDSSSIPPASQDATLARVLCQGYAPSLAARREASLPPSQLQNSSIESIPTSNIVAELAMRSLAGFNQVDTVNPGGGLLHLATSPPSELEQWLRRHQNR